MWNFLSFSKSPRTMPVWGTNFKNWETLDLFVLGTFPLGFSQHRQGRWPPDEGLSDFLDLCYTSLWACAQVHLPLPPLLPALTPPLTVKVRGLIYSSAAKFENAFKNRCVRGSVLDRREKSCLCSTNNLYLESSFSFSFENLYSHFTWMTLHGAFKSRSNKTL